MIKVVSYRSAPSNQLRHFFADSATGTQFRRVAGAWAWPQEKPGFLVVAGESRFPAKISRKHTVTCLFEASTPSFPELRKWVTASQGFFLVGEYYADTTNRAALTRWAEIQNDAAVIGPGAKPRPQIYPVEAPFVREAEERFSQYCHAIRDALVPHKSLVLGDCHNLRSACGNLPVAAPEETIEKHPEITALGFLVSALSSYPHAEIASPARHEPLDPIAGY